MQKKIPEQITTGNDKESLFLYQMKHLALYKNCLIPKITNLIIIFIPFFLSCNQKVSPIKENPKKLHSKDFALVLGDDVSLYSKPEIKSEILVELKKGEKVFIEKILPKDPKKEEFWIEVNHNLQKGYLFTNEDFSIKKNPVQIFYSYESDNHVILSDSVRIRKEPHLNSPVIGSLKKGDKVNVYSYGRVFQKIDNMIDKWVEIETKNKLRGYVYGWFISDMFDKGLESSDTGHIDIKPDAEQFSHLTSRCDKFDEFHAFENMIGGGGASGIFEPSGMLVYKNQKYYLIDYLYGDKEGCSATRFFSQ